MSVRDISSSNTFLEELKNFQWLFDDIDVESASKYVAGKYVVIVMCLPLPSIWNSLFISKLKAGSVSKVRFVSANEDAILVAVNKRSNIEY